MHLPPRPALSLLVSLALALLGAATVRAAPNIGYVYPAGGQRGTTVTVSVGGQTLSGASNAYFSIPGATVKVLGHERPLTQKEVNDAREKMQELQEKKRNASRPAAKSEPADAAKKAPAEATKPVWTDADEKKLADVRALLAQRPVRLTTPAIAETVHLAVTLPADAKPGDYDFRIKTPTGLSNPLVFQVSDLPESTDPVVIGSANPPQSSAAREAEIRSPAKKSAREVKLPTVVNGQIMPGEVDRIRFAALKGQKLTLAVSARALIPYLADAVPGWFQATLALYDPEGREVAYTDDYRFNPDPVVAYTIAADGDYTIEIKDSIYRGREDFVYRIAMGELPYLSGIFPLGTGPQAKATFDLEGWNLPSETLSIPADKGSSGTFLLAVRKEGRLSNTVKFALDSKPETLETTEPHSSPALAQAVALPAVINGRIDKPDDVDFYTFDGKAGSEVVAEVFARRLQSPLDSVLELTDAGGKRLAFNDDFDDKGAGLITHQADSRVGVTLPADGKYFLRITDAQHRGGREYSYRLRVTPPQPDFELRVVPSTLNVKAGSSLPVTVYGLRHDDFKGEIVLGLKDAPRGFILSGARIPAGQDKIQLTLTVPPTPMEEPAELKLIGRGGPPDRPIFHTAVPADDLMQAFLYRHLVTARDLKVCVTGRGTTPIPSSKLPLNLVSGGEARLQVASSAARNQTKMHVELSEPPPGITVKRTNVTREGFEVIFTCDAAQVKPGLEGNLILNIFSERTAAKAGKQVQRTPLGTVPAIPFTVVASGKRST